MLICQIINNLIYISLAIILKYYNNHLINQMFVISIV